MPSAVNESRIKAQKAQMRKDQETDKAVIVALMSTPDGRRWVWLKLAEAQIFVEGENLDLGVMAYEKGKRNGGLRLLKSVTAHTPDMYVRMTRENTLVDLNEEPQQDEDNE